MEGIQEEQGRWGQWASGQGRGRNQDWESASVSKGNWASGPQSKCQQGHVHPSAQPRFLRVELEMPFTGLLWVWYFFVSHFCPGISIVLTP